MLQDRYDEDKFFMDVQSLTSEMDRELAQIDTILDDDAIFQMIKHDFAQRYPQTMRTGRPSTPVEVTLRMLVVKRLYNWSYEKTVWHVRDSLVLRRFCRVYFEAVPDDKTVLRWANLIAPETLEALNGRVTAIASELKVTRGRKLRTDGTVVETNIHHPTDSSLLADGVRVLSRTLKRAQQLLQDTTGLSKAVFRDRTRSAKRAARQIARRGRQSGVTVKKTYRRLVDTTKASVRQAQQVLEALKQTSGAAAEGLCETLETFLPRVEQVLVQTVRRVCQEEQVPAAEKVVSLFEPHTDIIKRGKVNRDVEFGHKVWLGEVDGGIISGYRILDGNPADSDQWQPSLDHHVKQFARPPDQASADRGVYAAPNETYAAELGVKRVVLPKPGARSEARRDHERQRWFKRGRRWHAGVEGRISVVKRKHGLDRCLDHGEAGFARWVGWGVIAANLTVMGRSLVDRAARA
jgi:IS5 family transposase